MRNESPNPQAPDPQTFDFYSLRFNLSACGPFVFPAVLSANVFRGAFGLTLRGTAPSVYRATFAPAFSSGPSGLANPPRPFVFRTRDLDGRSIEAGEPFSIGMNLFWTAGNADSIVKAFSEAIARMADIGFGPQRSRALLSADSPPPQILSLPLEPLTRTELIRVQFLSPTELKAKEGVWDTPLFAPLISRARDRISTLRALYGPGPLEIDFAALTTRASAIKLVASEIHHVEASRRSSRTGEIHPLGGFVGAAEYAGPVSEFVPYLHIAAHTGIGRQTVWGKGEIAVQERTKSTEPAGTVS